LLLDFHRTNAAEITGLPLEQVTDEQRAAAKPVAFGSIYGISPKGLVAAAWNGYRIELSEADARLALERFFARYSQLRRWMRKNFEQCQRENIIRIGCGRVVEAAWEQSCIRYTQACNLPIQGICADAMMRAIILVHDSLKNENIDGGLVAAVHDELLLEVSEVDAERAKALLERGMIQAFEITFPGAPTRGVATAKIGKTWADLK
jgi:DNA polymerase I